MLAVLLAGCSAGNRRAAPVPKVTGTPMASPASYNAEDVRLATVLLAHRREAVALAEVGVQRARDAQVRQLAEGLRQGYEGDIRKLNGLLTAWGRPSERPPATAEQDRLRGVSAEAFDDAFLQALMTNTRRTVSEVGRHRGVTASGEAQQLAASVTSAGTALLVSLQEVRKG
ncbi:DUF305 domain-containing protein [Micromonospora maritima]|uniref:DUF305 domain-containing protein n=1 Tax=Micromonospora maritima TaxID=986711 RepID=UPI00157D99D8|nr:DUF305 domain-containing protein [Micromonospora maritima]